VNTPPRLRVYVEGYDDAHFLRHFLIATLKRDLPVNEKAGISWAGDFSRLLRIPNAVQVQTDFERLAIIVDANADPAKRWEQLRAEVTCAPLPEDPEEDGTILAFPTGRNIGIWIMPDNSEPGSLESFLSTIRSTEDPQPELWDKASQCIPANALFASKDRPKAELHTWLAWQKEPGPSFKVAFGIGCFDLSHPLAQRLADFFRRLC